MNAVNPWVPPAGLVPPPFYAPSARTGYSYMKPGVKLAQGSAPPSRIVVPFDVIVLAAREYQDQPDLSAYFVIRAPLRDGPMPSVEERALIHATARDVANHVLAGKRVLVTCWQGRNRSGVIVGLALVELGLPRDQAITRVRGYRNGLTNDYFRAMVAGML